MTMRRPLIVAVCCMISIAQAIGQKNPDAAAIMNNVEKGSSEVKDFVATIEASIDMERIRVPKMNATMYFKKPDKVHFSSTNFAMLPREGVALNPSLLVERYDPKLIGDENLNGRRVQKLELTGKSPAIRPGRLLVWVDPSTWTISKVETVPYQGRSLKLEFTYAAQPGGYLLPKEMKATFEIATRDTLEKRLDLDMAAPQQFEEVQRPSRSGTITVKYLDYKVNTGLSDDLFEKKSDPVKGK